MLDLYNFILEMNFQSKDFGKHAYVPDVINHLCTKPSIRLGKNGEVVYNIDSDIQPNLKADFEAAGKRLSIDDFNKIVSKYNLPTWTKIFKGDFSLCLRLILLAKLSSKRSNINYFFLAPFENLFSLSD